MNIGGGFLFYPLCLGYVIIFHLSSKTACHLHALQTRASWYNGLLPFKDSINLVTNFICIR